MTDPIIPTQDQLDRIRGMVPQGFTSTEIGATVGLHRNKVCKIVAAHGFGPWPKRAQGNNSPSPADFVEQWRTMNRAALVAYYGVSQNTVARWAKECGLQRDRGLNVGLARRAQVVKRIKPFRMHGGHKPTPIETVRDMTRVGLAVEWLRRLSAVSRCRADGVLDQKGEFWRRGSATLTDEQIVALADEIRARDMRRIAA